MVPVLFGNWKIVADKSLALSILLRRMGFAMALKVAPAMKYTGIFELQPSRRRIRANDGRIKIYQVGIVRTRALNGTDTVSIVTCRAGDLLLQVFGVLRKAFIV